MYLSLVNLLLILSCVSGRVLRGITQIVIPPAPASGTSSNSAAYSSGTFAPVTFGPPSGNTAPPPQVTTAAFQVYSASFPSSVTLNWQAASTPFSFDTSNIANLNVNNLGGNFAVINTAPYTYSPSTRCFAMQYWLCKSEPGDWSIIDHEKKKVEHWDGVRNYQANNNMKKMKKGDLAFMYHSISDKSVVGILKVVKEHYPDHTDKTNTFGMVDFEFVSRVDRPVHLDEFKENKILAETALVKQMRLSVMPLTKQQWDEVIRLSKTKKADEEISSSKKRKRN